MTVGSLEIRAVKKTDRKLLEEWVAHGEYAEKVRASDSSQDLSSVVADLLAGDKEHECLLIESDGKVRALVELLWPNEIDKTVEVDFSLVPSSYLTPFLIVPVLRILGRYIFKERGYRKIYSFIYSDNEKSVRLFSRFFHREATLPFSRGASVVEAHIFCGYASEILPRCE